MQDRCGFFLKFTRISRATTQRTRTHSPPLLSSFTSVPARKDERSSWQLDDAAPQHQHRWLGFINQLTGPGCARSASSFQSCLFVGIQCTAQPGGRTRHGQHGVAIARGRGWPSSPPSPSSSSPLFNQHQSRSSRWQRTGFEP